MCTTLGIQSSPGGNESSTFSDSCWKTKNIIANILLLLSGPLLILQVIIQLLLEVMQICQRHLFVN